MAEVERNLVHIVATLKAVGNIPGHEQTVINRLRGEMGEISKFYNFSSRLFIFGTHIPPIIAIHAAKFDLSNVLFML